MNFCLFHKFTKIFLIKFPIGIFEKKKLDLFPGRTPKKDFGRKIPGELVNKIHGMNSKGIPGRIFEGTRAEILSKIS